MPIYVKQFNIMLQLCYLKFSNEWLIGLIKPIFKIKKNVQC